jgi:copper homeostasis protein (lipoprotein)
MASLLRRLAGLTLSIAACSTEQTPRRPARELVVKPVGLSAPASFAGDLPCADCSALRTTLTLRDDGLYLLRSEPLGQPGGNDRSRLELGHWQQAPERARLTLRSAAAPLRGFQIVSPWRLRQLDHNGNPIRSQQPYELERLPALDSHGDPVVLRGTYADRFTECGSGRVWRVARERNVELLERAELAARARNEGVDVVLLGHFAERPRPAGGGTEEVIVVHRHAAARSSAGCSGDIEPFSLEDRDWTPIEVDGRAHARRSGALRLVSSRRQVRASAGCLQLIGGYQVGPHALSFQSLTVVRPPCAIDPALARVLGETDRYRVDGWELELLRGERVLARFDAFARTEEASSAASGFGAPP